MASSQTISRYWKQKKNAATVLQALDIVDREVVFNNVVIKGDLIIGAERDVKSRNSVLVFTRGIDILNTIVCGNFHLYGTRMLQGANFSDTHLGQSAQIDNAVALRSVIFKNASVSNTLRITNSIFQDMLDLSCVTSVDGPKHNRVGLHLDGNIFRRQFDLGARNCQYETYELATLSITGSEFTKGPVNLTNLVAGRYSTRALRSLLTRVASGAKSVLSDRSWRARGWNFRG